MKKVLIITYYWPPSGGAGVQRWLKFAKYLRRVGWEPVIYTPLNPEYPSTDPALQMDIPEGITVLKTPIREPYMLYKWFSGLKGSERVQPGFISETKRPALAAKISAWIRGNLFIPDARCLWISPSIKYLTKWLKHNKVDALVSTGPPHSMHMIALGVKKKMNIPWLADFRDPWTQIDFFPKLMLTPWAESRHKKLEQSVLATADRVVTVSQTCAHNLENLCGRSIEVVANGYDEDDFDNLPPFSYDSFRITHLGSLNADRNPHKLWEALANLVNLDPFFAEKLSVRLIGKTDISVIDSIATHGLSGYLEKIDYLPHDQALNRASRSAVLLLAINNAPNALGIATGKLYEYFALQRPILAIGPENGDAAALIRQTESGRVADFDDRDKMIQILQGWKEDFLLRQLDIRSGNSDQHTRRKLTSQLANILEAITSP